MNLKSMPERSPSPASVLSDSDEVFLHEVDEMENKAPEMDTNDIGEMENKAQEIDINDIHLVKWRIVFQKWTPEYCS